MPKKKTKTKAKAKKAPAMVMPFRPRKMKGGGAPYVHTVYVQPSAPEMPKTIFDKMEEMSAKLTTIEKLASKGTSLAQRAGNIAFGALQLAAPRALARWQEGQAQATKTGAAQAQAAAQPEQEEIRRTMAAETQRSADIETGEQILNDINVVKETITEPVKKRWQKVRNIASNASDVAEGFSRNFQYAPDKPKLKGSYNDITNEAMGTAQERALFMEYKKNQEVAAWLSGTSTPHNIQTPMDAKLAMERQQQAAGVFSRVGPGFIAGAATTYAAFRRAGFL